MLMVGVVTKKIYTRVIQKFCNICVRANSRNKFLELDGIELVPYLADSLYQIPSVYFLFTSMDHFLSLKRFNNQEELKASVKDKKWCHQKIGRKRVSDGAARWALLWMINLFCGKLKNKTNKSLK